MEQESKPRNEKKNTGKEKHHTDISHKPTVRPHFNRASGNEDDNDGDSKKYWITLNRQRKNGIGSASASEYHITRNRKHKRSERTVNNTKKRLTKRKWRRKQNRLLYGRREIMLCSEYVPLFSLSFCHTLFNVERESPLSRCHFTHIYWCLLFLRRSQ